jgi:hypothetical protein
VFAEQTAPELGPVAACAQAPEAKPEEPVDVDGGEPPHRDQIGDRPGFGLEPEGLEFVGSLGRQLLIGVDAIDEAREPAAGFLGQRRFDRRRGAGEIENAERLVDVGGERPDDLRQPSARHASHELHLREAQMRVHEPERIGRVVVGFGEDERDLMIVPQDHDLGLKRRELLREGVEPILKRGRLGQ